MEKTVIRRLPDVADEIRDADLMLLRGRAWQSLLIARAGRSCYSHAAMASRIFRQELHLLEMREWHGGRKIDLAEEVARCPGRWDLFRVNPHGQPFNAVEAVMKMSALTRQPYGWWNLGRAALLHLPLVRLLVRAEMDDRATPKHPPFCSSAIAIACRAGGQDPVPHLADRLTEPGDLARSRFFKYQLTLVP